MSADKKRQVSSPVWEFFESNNNYQKVRGSDIWKEVRVERLPIHVEKEPAEVEELESVVEERDILLSLLQLRPDCAGTPSWQRPVIQQTDFITSATSTL